MQTLSTMVSSCMFGADRVSNSWDSTQVVVGCEQARVYTYPRPARSADREKGAIVCGRVLVGLAEESWNGNKRGLV